MTPNGDEGTEGRSGRGRDCRDHLAARHLKSKWQVRMEHHCTPLLYRVGQVVVDLGWVDFDFYVPSPYPIPQPILPNFQLPKQNGAGSGMPKIDVNPTKVHDHQPNPVLLSMPKHRASE